MSVRGGRPLEGTVAVRGAKNLVSKAMVAAVLGTTPSRLRNVPDVSDVRIVSSLLSLHGVAVGQRILRLDAASSDDPDGASTGAGVWIVGIDRARRRA